MTAPQFARPPPSIPDDIVRLSYPAPHVLHVALNRPKAYNAMSRALTSTLSEIFDWYEEEPSLWVAILGSTNRKAWCAGADLKEWVSQVGLERIGARKLAEHWGPSFGSRH